MKKKKMVCGFKKSNGKFLTSKNVQENCGSLNTGDVKIGIESELKRVFNRYNILDLHLM